MAPKARWVVRVKRVYEPSDPQDGCRVLVDRLWPRGLRKGELKCDVWLKELAPSDKLRKWFAHDPAKWEEFQRLYAAEVLANTEALNALLELAKKGPVTLLFSAGDPTHNQAVALREIFLEWAAEHGGELPSPG